MGLYGEYNSENVIINNGLERGIYKVIISGEELVEKDDKKYIQVEYEVAEGSLKGFTQRDFFNIFHEDDIVKRIAEEKLKRIADATGKPVDDEHPLLGRTLTIHVRPQKKNPDFNEVWKYESIDADVIDDEIPL